MTQYVKWHSYIAMTTRWLEKKAHSRKHRSRNCDGKARTPQWPNRLVHNPSSISTPPSLDTLRYVVVAKNFWIRGNRSRHSEGLSEDRQRARNPSPDRDIATMSTATLTTKIHCVYLDRGMRAWEASYDNTVILFRYTAIRRSGAVREFLDAPSIASRHPENTFFAAATNTLTEVNVKLTVAVLDNKRMTRTSGSKVICRVLSAWKSEERKNVHKIDTYRKQWRRQRRHQQKQNRRESIIIIHDQGRVGEGKEGDRFYIR